MEALLPRHSPMQGASIVAGGAIRQRGSRRRDLLAWASSLAGVGKAMTGTATTVAATPPFTSTQDRMEPRLAQDGEVQRAVALLQLGDTSAAYGAFEALAERLSDAEDASGLAQVVIYLRYHADADTSMRVAEILSQMDAKGNPLKWPALLLKTLYPTPYAPP